MLQPGGHLARAAAARCRGAALKLLGFGAAIAVAFQIGYLTWPSTQGAVAAGVSALLISQLWSVRQHLNQHLDMLVLMTAYGGFGMLPLPGAPSCHVSTEAFVTMNAGMLALGVPAMLFGSRCMSEARRQHRLTTTVIADVAGMFAGMAAAHYHLPALFGLALLHHLMMLLGMLAGMGAARLFLSTVLGRIANGKARLVPL